MLLTPNYNLCPLPKRHTSHLSVQISNPPPHHSLSSSETSSVPRTVHVPQIAHARLVCFVKPDDEDKQKEEVHPFEVYVFKSPVYNGVVPSRGPFAFLRRSCRSRREWSHGLIDMVYMFRVAFTARFRRFFAYF